MFGTTKRMTQSHTLMKFYRAPRTKDIQNFVSVIYTHAIVEAVYALRHLTPDAGV